MSVAAERVRMALAGRATPFQDALDALWRSLDEEAQLHERGEAAAIAGALNALRVQHVLGVDTGAGALARFAGEIEDRLDRAVFIVGFPRSGTTYLHNLLALHPALAAPKLWELLSPCGEDTEDGAAQAQASAQRYVADYYARAPGMRIVHPMDALRPDECQRLLGHAFSTLIYAIRYQVPSYADWHLSSDQVPAYRFHRRQLGAILQRRLRLQGAAAVGVPLLKDPFHVWHLDALREVYPKARFLHLERPVQESLASTCSLTETARLGGSDAVEPRAIGAFWATQFERAQRTLPASLRAIPAGCLLPVAYEELTRAPLTLTRRIADTIGLPLDATAVARMNEFIAAKPLLTAGTHTYDARRYGL